MPTTTLLRAPPSPSPTSTHNHQSPNNILSLPPFLPLDLHSPTSFSPSTTPSSFPPSRTTTSTSSPLATTPTSTTPTTSTNFHHHHHGLRSEHSRSSCWHEDIRNAFLGGNGGGAGGSGIGGKEEGEEGEVGMALLGRILEPRPRSRGRGIGEVLEGRGDWL